MVTFTGNSVGDTATYTCNSGFELIGDAMATCTAAMDGNSASFQPAAPVCRREFCINTTRILVYFFPVVWKLISFYFYAGPDSYENFVWKLKIKILDEFFIPSIHKCAQTLWLLVLLLPLFCHCLLISALLTSALFVSLLLCSTVSRSG